MIRISQTFHCGARPLVALGCCLSATLGFLLVTAVSGAPQSGSKATSIKELVEMVQVADLQSDSTLQRLIQDADLLEYRELGDILEAIGQDNGADPELSAHLEDLLWEYLEVTAAVQRPADEGGVAAPPANDACTSATVISAVPYANSVSGAEATDDTTNPSCDSSSNTTGANNGVWYVYTPAANCTAQLSEGSSNDTAMSIWTGGCGALVQSFCTDPESGTTALTGGTTYYILVSQWGTTTPTGNFTFALDCTTAAPANDSCSGATTIGTVPFLGATSAVAATDDSTANPSCDSSSNSAGANNGAWWKFTPVANCTAVMSELSSLDVAISVWTGACASPTQALCSDPESAITLAMTAGTTYNIMISAWSSTNPTSGAYTLSFDCAACGDGIINGAEQCDGAAVGACTNGCTPTCTCAPPANDECAGATQVFTGSNPFTNAGSTVGTDTKCDSNMSADVWYYYMASCSGAATIDTCGGVANNGPDTVLQIYDGCGCPPTTTIGCADDTTGCGTSGFSSSATVSVTSGNCYRIRVGNYSSAGTTVSTVTGTLSISCVAAVCGNNVIEPGEVCDGTSVPASCVHGCAANCQCAAPANDNCANALTAVDGANAVNRAFATTDGAAQPNPPCDFPFGDDQIYYDVWYNYTATCTGRLLTDTCNGVGLDTRMAVYAGCSCPVGADPLSCNDDSGSTDELSDPDQDPDTCNQLGGSPYESATRNQVVQGQCYTIRMGSYGSSSTHDGADELYIQCVAEGACCDANGSCSAGLIPSECIGTFYVGADCTLESCCLNDVCSMNAPECCQQLGGTPGGPGSTCNNCGNGIVDCGEQCDGGDCCTPNCTFVAGGTTCRGSAGVCDVAEACTGASADCPADGFSSGNECRGSAGVCDTPESCDGTGPNCPPDAFATGGVCRAAAGVCDAPESCDGSGPNCPADLYLLGDTCRNSTGPCDPAETCSGNDPNCPPDATITSCIDGDGCCPQGCNGNNDSDCPPVPVPTVTEAGLVVLMLVGILVGAVLFKRRQTSIQ